MTKTTIKETTEKFDKDGKLVERIIREETSEDNTDYVPYTIPYNPSTIPLKQYQFGEPYCSTNAVYASNKSDS